MPGAVSEAGNTAVQSRTSLSPHGTDILLRDTEGEKKKKTAQQGQRCDRRSLGAVGVQGIDVPNPVLGVRGACLEQMVSELRPEEGARTIQEK